MTKESEIVRALRHTCDGCNPTPCCEFEALGPEAADLIESLQAQLAEAQRRADAAVEDLYMACKHTPCNTGVCTTKGCKGNRIPCEFEWRGPRAEKGEAE